MRLIDGDAMMQRLEEWNTNDPMDIALYNFSMHRILEQPTIEPERKTGKWITSDDVYETGICSCCRYDTQEPVSYVITNFEYCPNCGADMRGEGEK